MQVPELQCTVCSELSQQRASTLLLGSRLPEGPQTRQSEGLAGQAGEPKLLSGCPKCPACPPMAKGAPGLLEELGSQPPYLTRRLPGATPCQQGTYARVPSPYLTRPLLPAHPFVYRADLHVDGQYLTRRHRRDRTPGGS